MKAMVQTVRGRISPDQLGKTMTHEHFLWDQRCWWGGEPTDPVLREFVHQPVRLDNLGMMRYYTHQNLDNIVQLDPEVATEEAKIFKRAGGGTIVDTTSIGIGRDPQALLAIANGADLNVVMGSGYYVASSHPPELKELNAAQVAKRIVREFERGVDDTGIRPGVIGEIGVSDAGHPEEVKILQAAAIAQKETGAALYIHPPIFETKGLQILDVVERAGAALAKVVMCHCDPTLDQPSYHDALARRGACIEYDQFGLEIMASEGIFLPSDSERIRAVKQQIANGHLARILMSQDVCFKMCLVRYGGCGYAHILRDLPPLMVHEGVTDEQLNTILQDNPRRLLACQ